MVVVDGEYLYQFHYPKLVDGKKAVQVAYNLNIASAKAIAKFKELGLDKDGGRIGTILNLTPTYSASNSKEDLAAAHFAELWNNKMFLEPAINGHFPEELEEVLKKEYLRCRVNAAITDNHKMLTFEQRLINEM